MVISLKKTRETVFRCEQSNAIIYNITKTKVILFSKAHSKKPKEEIIVTKLVFWE